MPRLTNKQFMALDLLSSGMKKPEVAAIVGVSLPTIYNWLKNELFQEKLIERTEELENVMRTERLQQGRAIVAESMQELLKRLRDPYRRDDITTRELLAIYKDTVSTMQVDIKTIIETKEEDKPETKIDLDNDAMRKDLLDVYLKHTSKN